MVELLLRNRADPGLYDDEGYLPLFSALSQDHAGITICLLQDHVDPGHLAVIQTSQSTTLHVACRFASPIVVECLLEGRADPNVSDSHGKTPLHEVVRQNCSELEDRVIQTLHLLADYGASPDIESEQFVTARDIGIMALSPWIREMFATSRVENAPIPRNRLRASKLKAPVLRASSPGGIPTHQHNTQLDVDSNNSFSSLVNPSMAQGGGVKFNEPQTVWFDKPVTEQLFTPKSSSLGRCDNLARQAPLAAKSLSERVDSKQKVPEVLENVQGAFMTSNSAKFWGSLSPRPREDSQPAPELIGDTKSPRRTNQKKKWVALDIL
ncbi:putative ankyrin repeat protein [Fusarium austroafricanum]|uniref:Putative ankyrin repeat protein n=1 Tax=Fusarium austroafricanum TaxID=2364996 RepID=A0A8H4JGN0_9HYPO|nr:putative ankyrin repeat protein [Fusarium austroafricanum]